MVRCAAQHVERADADGQAAEVAKLLICRLSDHVSLVWLPRVVPHYMCNSE